MSRDEDKIRTEKSRSRIISERSLKKKKEKKRATTPCVPVDTAIVVSLMTPRQDLTKRVRKSQVIYVYMQVNFFIRSKSGLRSWEEAEATRREEKSVLKISQYLRASAVSFVSTRARFSVSRSSIESSRDTVEANRWLRHRVKAAPARFFLPLSRITRSRYFVDRNRHQAPHKVRNDSLNVLGKWRMKNK